MMPHGAKLSFMIGITVQEFMPCFHRRTVLLYMKHRTHTALLQVPSVLRLPTEAAEVAGGRQHRADTHALLQHCTVILHMSKFWTHTEAAHVTVCVKIIVAI